MTPLEQSIMTTVVYFDRCDFALTYPELFRYLWRSPSTTLAEVMTVTKQLPQLVETAGCITLQERTALVALRQTRYLESERKYQKRRRMLWLLSLLPGVEAIFIVNTLAYHNVQASSDIDLLIVSRPGKIWATRFYTTLLAKLLGVRPKPGHTKDTICLSFYVTPTGLDRLATIRLNNDDAAEAYWLAQAMPVYDPKHYAQRIVNDPWLKTVLPHVRAVVPHENRSITITWLHRILHLFEVIWLWNDLFRIIQLKLLPVQLKKLAGSFTTGIVVLDNDLLKFHTHDPRPQLNQSIPPVTPDKVSVTQQSL